MRLISREYALVVAVALVSGIVAIVSLVLPWVNTADKSLNAFQLGDLVAESLSVAFIGTAFGFLAFFGGLMIVGAILMLTGFDSGQFVIYAGAILTIIFAVLGLIVSSIIPLVSPYIGAWLCLCCGIAGVISPKLHVRKMEP
jgi:hypothetical protein